MSSTHQRYRAIQTSLMQIFGHPTGHKARHVQTLTALIGGIVGSTHSQIPHIADHVPNHQAKTSSVIPRMMRWYQHDAITTDTLLSAVRRTAAGCIGGSAPAGLDHRWQHDEAWVCHPNGKGSLSRAGGPSRLPGRWSPGVRATCSKPRI
jgi:hypothetical protein